MQNAQTYFWISALTYPLIALYNVGAALSRVQGNSRVSMLAALIMNIINISLNALFIFGFHMGVAGAALGSLAARAFAAVFLMFLLHKGEHRIHLEWEQGIRSRWPRTLFPTASLQWRRSRARRSVWR